MWRGHQGQDDVAFFDVVLDPFPVDGNVSLVKLETGFSHQSLNAMAVDIHTVDFVFTAVDQSFTQCASDKAVYAEDQNVFFPVRFHFPPGGLARSAFLPPDEVHWRAVRL